MVLESRGQPSPGSATRRPTSRRHPSYPFAARYFANPTLDGTPVVTRNDDQIDFDWGSGSPDPALPDNGFSTRWTRTTDFEAGAYRFTVTGDE